MTNYRTITAAIQSSNTEALLDAYRRYTGNDAFTSDELFDFLITPTPQREEFLTANCACIYSSTDNIFTPTYEAL